MDTQLDRLGARGRRPRGGSTRRRRRTRLPVLILAGLALVASGVASPIAARSPGAPAATSSGIKAAQRADVGQSIGRAITVDARSAARAATKTVRAHTTLDRRNLGTGAQPATTKTAARDLNLRSGRTGAAGLSGPTPLIVAQPDPVVTTSFPGTTENEACGCEPPDPWIAVSPSHVVQTTNGLVRMSNRAGTTLVTMPTWALFAVPVDRFDADPRIIWDAAHGRWVGVILTSTFDYQSAALNLAVSETADPTGAWIVHAIQTSNVLPDYPGLSSSTDKIVLSSNDFEDGAAYIGPSLYIIDWANVIAGSSLFVRQLAFDDTLYTFRPAVMLSAAPNIPVIFEDGALHPRYLEVTGNAHSASPLVNGYDLGTTFGIADFTMPPSPVQPGAIEIVEAVDERPTDAVYRSGQLWFTATGDSFDGADHWAMARHTRVLTTANGSALTGASDLVTGQAGSHFFMPGVGINADGSAFMVATLTDPTATFPTTVLWAALAGGTITDVRTIDESTAAYTGDRWGDYVGVAADPAGAGAVWIAHELVAPDGSWRTSVVRVVSDGVAPSAPGTISQAQVTPATLGGTVSVRTSWGAATDTDSGVKSYFVERSDDGGGFFGVESAGTSITQPLLVGHTYRYRISAIDWVGNEGPPRTGALYRPTLYQSTSLTTVTGRWGTSTSSSYSGGTTRYSTTAGASATFTATLARSIAIVTTKSATRGSFKVYVDGVFRATISTYSARTRFRQLVYQFAWSAPGTHKIKIVVSGTAGRPRVDLDAFVVLR
jgi:hypothetical protein